ncbi:ComEC/Rec2 family competence protein [Gemella sp. Musashino-2025]
MKFTKRCIYFLSLLFLLLIFSKQIYAKDRVHIITVSSWSDAIILESDDHFAMIDTGEDYSYPDGNNPKYPVREGITKDPNLITEDRLFAHIKELGIKKLDFILLTHVHSDHTGAAADILKSIPTDKIYLKKYSDERISDKERLWDNLYSYDKVLNAAKETNVDIIQDIKDSDSHIKLGNISINLLNYKNEYDSDGNLKKVYDDNLNSILSVLNINNVKVFLGGDLENTDLKLEDYYAPLIGQVDVMKFNHHVETTKSNATNFIDTLRPKYIIKTGIRPVEENYKKYLDNKNIKIINAGRSDIKAVVLDFENNSINDVSTQYTHYGFYNENNTLKFKNWNNNYPEKGWLQENDNWYYIKGNGIVTVGWESIDGKYFYFNENGTLHNGILEDNGNTYYIDKNTGVLSDSWKKIDSSLKYFKKMG